MQDSRRQGLSSSEDEYNIKKMIFTFDSLDDNRIQQTKLTDLRITIMIMLV